MAKAKTQAARRRRPHHVDAERWNRLLIVGGVVAMIALALGVIAFGWWQTQIKPLSRTVLRVEDTKFNLAHLERRMKLERKENPGFANSGENLLRLPDVVLSQLELEGKLLEAADLLNISVSDEEVAAEIKERGNLADEVEASVFAARFREQVEDSGLSENEYRQMLKAQLLQEKVINYFIFLAPKEEPQVRGRYILISDEQVAKDALERLRAGEDFDKISQDVTIDVGTGSSRGDLEWIPRGGSALLPKEAQDFLFDEGQPGQIGELISSGNLFYIVQLLERDESRPLEAPQREQVAGREMFDWLSNLNTELDIDRNFEEEDALRALDDIL